MEEIETNAQGGMGSKQPWVELIDARALREIGKVFEHGARKYARDNWRACSADEHLRHAVLHCYGYLEPGQQYQDRSPEQLDELSHAACRTLMALAVYLQDDHVADAVPKGLAQAVDRIVATSAFAREESASAAALRDGQPGVVRDPEWPSSPINWNSRPSELPPLNPMTWKGGL